MKHFCKRFVTMCCILAVAVSACGCTINDHIVYFSGGAGLFNVFKIGDLKCSVKEARMYLTNYKNLYGHVGSVSLWDESFDTASMESSIKDAVLSHLTTVYSFDLYARDNKVELTKKEEQAIEDAAIEYYDSLSEDELKYLRVSEDDIEDMYTNYVLAEKVYFSLMETVDEEVSEDEMRVMDAYVLFVTDKETAQLVADKITWGNDFETLVNTYSEKDKTVVSFGRNTYTPEIESVVFQLNNGQISDMLSDENGYYFFQCVNKYNATLSQENKSNVISERKEQLVQEILQSQNELYYSHLNQKLWDKTSVNVDENIATDSFFEVLNSHISY
ncbi:MAG: peptidylprolyl isomerase [Lachnospiraceae bacterium]|nr:peptidylprolyl isomerase [Lachnospiraceae bacterium]